MAERKKSGTYFAEWYTQRNVFEIFLNQTEIRLCSTFSD